MPSRTLPSLTITNALPRHVDVLVVGLTTSGAQQVPKTIDGGFTKRFGMQPLTRSILSGWCRTQTAWSRAFTRDFRS